MVSARKSSWISRLLHVSGPGSALLAALVSPVAASTISGRVVSPDLGFEGPLRVTAASLSTGRRVVQAVDGNGSFAIADFPEGEAVLVVTRLRGPQDPLDTRVIEVPAAGARDVVLAIESPALAPTFNFVLYKGEYYNNQPSEGLANPVHVTAPGTTPSINFSLSPGGGTISGRVTAGGGLSGILVFAVGGGFISFDRTDAQGFYRITGLPAGTFQVAANTLFVSNENEWVGEYFDNRTSLFDADIVTVNEGADTPNINFSLALGGSLSGRVTAASGGAAVSGAKVSLSLPPLFLEETSTFTDLNGNYTFSGLRPSTEYRVHAEAQGYVSEYYNDQAILEQATPVTVNASGQTTNINLGLATGARIQGTVRQAGTGEPIPNMAVDAKQIDTGTWYYGSTSASGSYSIESLPAGTYYITLPETGQWWNNATTELDANPVPVAAGATVTGKDFTVQPCGFDPGQVVHISGRVTQAVGGSGVAGARVSIWISFGGSNWSEITSTLADGNGNYTFDCLAPGGYYVRAEAPFTTLLPEWYNEADSTLAADLVSVSAGGTQANVNFTLSPGGAISGKVTIAGTSTPLASITVVAKNGATGVEYYGLSDASGNYTVSADVEGGLPTGDYRVSAKTHSTADLALVPVILSRFEAFDVPEGVAVEWRIEGDEAVSGVHIYRSEEPANPLHLTDSPLPGDSVRFIDRTALPGIELFYWIGIIDREGREERFGPASARRGEAPILTQLFGPRPNPVRQGSEIAFTLARPGLVTLRIHDLAGRLVRTLIEGYCPAGASLARWDTRRQDGSPAPRGVYYVRLVAGPVVETEKLILTR